MKKVIDGKRYDTENAECIGSYTFSNSSDLCYVDEKLYVTKAGSYFFAGEGGAKSKYSTPISQNSWGGGSRLLPITKGEALAWAGRNLDGDTVEKYFSDLIEDA